MPGSALEAVAGNRSQDLGGDHPPGRLPCSLPGLASSPFSHPGIVSDLPGRLSSGSSLAARDRGDACQRSLRIRPRSGLRLLQSPLPSGQGVWRLETHDRSLTPERVRPADSVQDGNSRFCTVICQRGGFSSFPRSEGCVLSDPDPSIFEEAIEVHVRGDGLPVPSPVFRTVDRSPGFHQGLRSCVSVGTLSRGQTSPLSGRLVGSLLLGAGSQAGRPVASLTLSHPRDCDKQKKSDLVPSQTAKYLGMTIDTEAGKVFPSLARVEKFLTVAESFCTMDAPPAQLWQVILGHLASLERLVPHGRLRMHTLQWHLKAHWSNESDPPSLPVPLPREVRRDLSWWMVRDHLLTGVRFGTPAPDLHLYSDASCSGWGTHLLDQHVSGVWSDQEKLLHINLLEMMALFLGLQASRDSDVRRLDGRGVRQQARGHGFPGSMLVGQPPSEVDGEFLHPSRCEVSTRTRQCPGRCPQPSRASSRDRVVSPPSGGEVTASCLGQSVDRPLCDVPQRETAPVLLASPGSPGRLRGCVLPSLGRPGPVRVPSLSSGQSGDRQCPRVVTRRDDSGRTPLARKGVVRRPSSSTDPTTSCPALVGQPAPAAPLQPLPPRRPCAFREELLESCQGASDLPPHNYTSRDGRSSVVGVVEGALLQSTPLFQ